MGYNSINNTAREMYIDFDFELNGDGTYGSSHIPVTVSMVAPNQVFATKTALGTPLEVQGGAAILVVDNIKPELLEAFRGDRTATNSSLLPGVNYPALTNRQILIVFSERIQFQGANNAEQLKNILDVMLSDQPSVAINPSQYSVAAYSDEHQDTSATMTPSTRMIVVTLANPTSEAVKVSIRANTLWDGNKDAFGSNVMNNAFETDFLSVV
jgi:hypothetical protein